MKSPEARDWHLQIEDVKPGDQGEYKCSVKAMWKGKEYEFYRKFFNLKVNGMYKNALNHTISCTILYLYHIDQFLFDLISCPTIWFIAILK